MSFPSELHLAPRREASSGNACYFPCSLSRENRFQDIILKAFQYHYIPQKVIWQPHYAVNL